MRLSELLTELLLYILFRWGLKGCVVNFFFFFGQFKKKIWKSFFFKKKKKKKKEKKIAFNSIKM